MPSKLGPHCLRPTASARAMIDAGCRIVKLVDDFGLAPELANRPGVTVIGRVFAHDPRSAEGQRGEPPESAARRFVDSQKEKYLLNPAIKIWEGHNEPVWNSREDMEWYARFEAARLQILADMGLRGVIGCFATGNPGDIQLWQWFIPAVQAAKQFRGILGLHEYSSPWIWWMTGRFQINPNEDAGDEGWTTLRYRKVMRNFLRPAGCDDVQIAITEFGLDRVGPVPDGASSGNWRTNAEWWPQWDGSRDPIDYWRSGGRDAQRYYAEQMIWYDREIRQDANVLGATIYTFGHIDAAWRDYDVEGTAIVTHLADYIRREANVPDAAVTPGGSPPATQPAGSGAAAGAGPAPAAAGANLLTNPSFEHGHYHWQNVPELAIPKGWDFWYLEDRQTRLDRQDHDFLKPEAVVWNINDAPLEERKLFFVDGNYCLKVFKGWGPTWWRLQQKVGGLTPGGRYRFTVPVFPDLVMRYDQLTGKVFADDPLAGEHRLTARSGGQVVTTDWLDGTRVPFGKYTPLSLEFVSAASEAEVEVEIRGRWGLINNGWFVDALRLEAIGAGPGGEPKVPATGPSTAEGGNLLQNPSFEGGTFRPNPVINYLEAPAGWRFWYAPETTPRVSKQTESFRPPRAGVIAPATAQPDDHDGLAGGLPRAYRVAGNWRAIWFSLSQAVSGLTPGRRYRFRVHLMPDPVDRYGPGNVKQFLQDPDGGEVWLRATSAGQKSETYKRALADLQPGVYVTLSHDFTAATSEADVALEIRARYALTQNAWYVAWASLTAA